MQRRSQATSDKAIERQRLLTLHPTKARAEFSDITALNLADFYSMYQRKFIYTSECECELPPAPSETVLSKVQYILCLSSCLLAKVGVNEASR